MDEIITQVARAVACYPRLQILSRLARQKELAPTALAADLKLDLTVVSVHLRRLSTAGLIQRRRSASWSYGVARSPYGPQAFSGRMAGWLFKLLARPQTHLRGCDEAITPKLRATDADSRLHEIVFEAATAFTHMRRLCLLRHLTQGGNHRAEELTSELKISPSALSRHGGKLVRRGYVVAERWGLSLRYRLSATSKTPIHARMWQFVREEWEKNTKQKLQT